MYQSCISSPYSTLQEEILSKGMAQDPKVSMALHLFRSPWETLIGQWWDKWLPIFHHVPNVTSWMGNVLCLGKSLMASGHEEDRGCAHGSQQQTQTTSSSHTVRGNAVPRSRGYMYPGNEIVLNLCISLAMYVSLSKHCLFYTFS